MAPAAAPGTGLPAWPTVAGWRGPPYWLDSPWLRPGRTTAVTLNEPSATAAGYQVNFRYNVPGQKAVTASEPLAIDMAFDKTEVAVGESLEVAAKVTNRQSRDLPMVIVALPVPAGFAPADDAVTTLRRSPSVEKVQVTPRSLVLYLRSLSPGKPLELTYRLKATTPASVSVPGAEVYEYYDPARRAATPQRTLTIVPGV